MVISTLRRVTTVTKPEEFASRTEALQARILPFLQKQPGFVSYEMHPEAAAGAMVQTTSWQSDADCRAYLRNGAAAMAATMLDAVFPTAAFPNGTWVRETVEQAG